MVASTYVRSIDASRAFYAMLGFTEVRSGQARASAWSYLQHGNHFILLAATTPPLSVPALPLLFYFYVADLDAAVAQYEAGGLAVQRLGRPAHALGGEAKVLDPDGNTILLGQREAGPSQPDLGGAEPEHFSLLREAAALVEARGGAALVCQSRRWDDSPCDRPAEVKLADSTGASLWVCLIHADEILVTVRNAFIASQTDPTLTSYRSRNP